VVIAGYTEPRNSRKFFGSLLLGLYDGDKLVYIGHTGSGFNTKTLEAIHKKLQPLVTKDCPFVKCPKGNMPVTWVKPKLVCEIKFTEWTKDRIARHPIFMGLREDKKAKDVGFEKSITMKKATSHELRAASKKGSSKKTSAKSAIQKSVKSKSSAKSAIAKSLKSNKSVKSVVDLAAGENQTLTLNGHELKLSNLNKLYWKKEGFTKGDMINYYLQIVPYMMPYMKDRPQSMNRHPNGIDGPNFFQKNTKGKIPDWIKTHEDFSESTNEHIDYLVCSDEATLIYMANSGCIEMNPWHSRTQTWEYPDWCLIDLDPDKKNTFDQVMEVAKVVKQVLDSIGAEACCKTSGSSGIHIYIPLGAKYDYDQSKQLAELIVTLVNHELPDLTSMERSPAKRNGKLYLDYLQNRQTQTAAAPYSLRPKPGVPVSTPIDWTELKKGLTPTTYNARNIFDRLKTEGDLFKPVLGKGINLEKVLSKLASQLK
jgi:bifunctional non-homologous end joining protein LigD